MSEPVVSETVLDMLYVIPLSFMLLIDKYEQNKTMILYSQLRLLFKNI